MKQSSKENSICHNDVNICETRIKDIKQAYEMINHTNSKCDPVKGFGVTNKDVLQEVIVQAALGMAENKNSAIQIVGNSTLEMKPQDPIETKLCAKETTLYSLAMTYLHRAESNRNSEDVGQRLWFETDINLALKLLKAHNQVVETLNRYRRGTKQKIIVQHQNVQINDGGKAIVGQIEGGAGNV